LRESKLQFPPNLIFLLYLRSKAIRSEVELLRERETERERVCVREREREREIWPFKKKKEKKWKIVFGINRSI